MMMFLLAGILGAYATSAAAEERVSEGCYHHIRVERDSGEITEYIGPVDDDGTPLSYNATLPESYVKLPSVTVSLELRNLVKCETVSVGDVIDAKGSEWRVAEILS